MPTKKGKKLFEFAIIADSHLNPAEGGNTSPWQTNHLANQRNEIVLRAINRLRPSFTVHVGDVVHPLPYTKDFVPAAHFASQLYQQLGSPFYIAPGNHDIGDKCLAGNPAATITTESCAIYEEHFGKQWTSFEHEGMCFIVINACLLGSGLADEKAQWAWLEQVLSKNQERRKFLFSHYPPFITEPREDNHYDNIDREPRLRLLELLAKFEVEALFAGHVHTFFLNRYENTWMYALPSSTNFRQDYSELFRVNPAEELGRNDLGKLGFFLVEVFEQGHVARFVRTYGSTADDDVEVIAAQIGADVRSSQHETIGVDFSHEWANVTRLPYNPPLDTFVRKTVRNDYWALNLWDAGVRNIRVPVADILDGPAFERLKLLGELGHKITVFTVQNLSAQAVQAVQELKPYLHAIEIICTQNVAELLQQTETSLAEFPVFYSPIQAAGAQDKGDGAPYDHQMASGLTLNNYLQLNEQPRVAATFGLVVNIAREEPVFASIAKIAQTSAQTAIPAIAHVKLAPSQSFKFPKSDKSTMTRVAEAAIAALAYPELTVRVDTFMDIDRGYFPRHGLVDRRHNPRAAARLVREITDQLSSKSAIYLQQIHETDQELIFTLSWEGGKSRCRLSLEEDRQAEVYTKLSVLEWEDI